MYVIGYSFAQTMTTQKAIVSERVNLLQEINSWLEGKGDTWHLRPWMLSRPERQVFKRRLKVETPIFDSFVVVSNLVYQTDWPRTARENEEVPTVAARTTRDSEQISKIVLCNFFVLEFSHLNNL